MFSFFRRGITAKIMLGILAIGLFAIVITGFGTGGTGLGDMGGGGTATVATVGGEKITAQDVTAEMDRQLTQARQRQPELDMANFLNTGALDQVIAQMIDVAAARAFGREQGLAASKKLIDQEIANIPAFQNLAGQFDPQAFRAALAQEGMSEQQLRREIETRIIQRQLLLPAAGSAFVPQGIAHQYASLLLESRTGSIGVVPTQAMGPGREPSEQEVANFFRQNQGRYTVPERRVIRYALLGQAQVAAQAQATDAEIEAAYRQNPAYAARETRRLSQVVLPDEAAARAFVQKVNGGTAFAQAAAQAGFGAGDIALGDLSREDYARTSNAAVANAVFGGAKGAVVGPVRGPIGWHVVRVEDVKTIPARPLASVRAEIAAQVQQRKAQTALGDLVTRIENAIGEGSSLAEVAQANRLELRETPPVTATGAAPGNPEWVAQPELRALLETAFDMEADEEPVVEQVVPNQSFAVLQIGAVTPAAAPPLTAVRDRVKADLIARRASERAKAVATSLVAKINAGMPAAQAFAQADVALPPLQNVSAVRREIAGQDGRVPPPMTMLFSLPSGKARLLEAPNGQGWFVVYLQTVVPGDASKEAGLTELVRGQFSQVFGDEYGQQFTAAMRGRLKVKRNEDAVRQLRKALTGGGAAQ